MSSLSLRLRVIVGFAVVVGLLATTSLLGVSKLGSLNDAESTIAEGEAPFIVALQGGAVHSRDANVASVVILTIMVSDTLQGVIDNLAASGPQAVADPAVEAALRGDPSVLSRIVLVAGVPDALQGDAVIVSALASSGGDPTAAFTGDIAAATQLVSSAKVVAALAANPTIAQAVKGDAAAMAAGVNAPAAASDAAQTPEERKAATAESLAQYTKTYQDGVAAAHASFAEARALAGSDERVAMVDAIDEGITLWTAGMDQLVEAYRTTGEFDQEIIADLNAKETAYKTLVDEAIADAQGGLGEAHASFGDESSSARTTLVGGLLVAVAVAIAATIIVVRSVTSPLRRTVTVLQQMADGDLTVSLDVDSEDEIGQMADALNRTVSGLGTTMLDLAQGGEALSTAANELSELSREMTTHARETSEDAAAVSAASDVVQTGVSSVAAATEELAASFREISTNAVEAARIANRASEAAEVTSATVERLRAASDDIASVMGLISSIAEQTNLLALNATIEAARAGEAGKGFAVVATEVKELAQQTGGATEEVGKKVAAIRAEMRSAVDSIAEIRTIIESINETQTSIAGAVEQQTVATSGISQHVADVSGSTQEVARNIAAVATVADATTDGARRAEQAATTVAAMAEQLRVIVDRFHVSTGESGQNGAAHSRLSERLNGHRELTSV
jgi:methyl-accepting chemotaxis protein